MLKILLGLLVVGSSAFAAPAPICAKVFRRQFRNASVALVPFQASSWGGGGYMLYDVVKGYRTEEFALGKFLAVSAGFGASSITSFNLAEQKSFLWVLYKARLEMTSESVGYHTLVLTEYMNALLDGKSNFYTEVSGYLPGSVLATDNVYAQSMAGRRFKATDLSSIFKLLEQKGDLCPSRTFGIKPIQLLETMVWVSVANQNSPSIVSKH